MRLTIIRRIMEIEEGVIHRGRLGRPRRITPYTLPILAPIYEAVRTAKDKQIIYLLFQLRNITLSFFLPSI